MSAQEILSVGIDLGTSTTQVIFSRLTMENTAMYFSVPRVSIVDKKVVYSSEIHQTPLLNHSLIDADAIRKLVEEDYHKAGFLPSNLSTGAVIITGESAKKENSRIVLEKLSDLAGEFVVSTAGPDLEAIIAGKGSGAWQYSVDNSCACVNIDIGGGTSNIVLFHNGDVITKGCVDIGGKQICISDDLTVNYISSSAMEILRWSNIPIAIGEKITLTNLRKICEQMAVLLFKLLEGYAENNLPKIETIGSSKFSLLGHRPTIFFSGGVANSIYFPEDNWGKYGDIGVILGQEIRSGEIFKQYNVLQGTETIRATVVGAGNYTTTVSGSTIFYSHDLFPFKNLPALCLSKEEETVYLQGDGKLLADKISWFLQQNGEEQFLLVLNGTTNPSYDILLEMSSTLAMIANKTLPPKAPLILCVRTDMAKALGQTVYRLLEESRPVIAIDSVAVEQDDYVDMGRPLMNGLVIPIIVKTLIFG